MFTNKTKKENEEEEKQKVSQTDYQNRCEIG